MTVTSLRFGKSRNLGKTSNYFKRLALGTLERARHLCDAGVGDNSRTNKFLADIEAGKLPPLSFYKPQGNLNTNAGDSDVESGPAEAVATNSRKIKLGASI